MQHELSILENISEYDQSAFNIFALTTNEFFMVTPPLPRLQELTYALYTSDGLPRPLSDVENINNSNEIYLVAVHNDLTPFFRQPTNPQLQKLAEELKTYTQVAGFIHIQWGKYDDTNPVLEAQYLMTEFIWPKEDSIGYVGSFTTNPLLPKETRLCIQTLLHHKLYEISRQYGFDRHILTILQPHVVAFVQASGLLVDLYPEAKPNWEHPVVQSLVKDFPKYWENPPQLFRFIPFKFD